MTPKTPKLELIRFATPDILATQSAAAWLDELASTLPTLGDRPCTVAFSGGRIASRFFRELAAQAQARGCDLAQLDYFWADERCVPPTDPESNYRLAYENLFLPLRIAEEKIHRIRGEIDRTMAAREAETEICRVAPLDDEGQPVLEFVFLGLGEDGHVASLFPGAPDREPKAVYRAVLGPKPPPNRITINYATLTAARRVWVLASGPGKEQALRACLEEGSQTPLGRVIALRQGQVKIATDIQIEGGR